MKGPRHRWRFQTARRPLVDLAGAAARRGARLRPWAELVRLPNLLSAPGDPLAGAFLAGALGGATASASRILAAAAAALCLYAFGLVLNDIADLPQDRRDRPERPLPRGALRPGAALSAAVVLALAGLLNAGLAGRGSFVVALLLLGLILSYSLLLKGNPIRAAAAMGLCRGCSLLMGAAVVGVSPRLLLAAAATAGYIASVTRLAAFETRPQRTGSGPFVPAAFLGGGFLVIALLVRFTAAQPPGGAHAALALLTAGSAFGIAWNLGRGLAHKTAAPRDTQQAIGGLIRLLLPWQAALVFLSGLPGSLTLGLLLVLLYPCHAVLSRRFAPS